MKSDAHQTDTPHKDIIEKLLCRPADGIGGGIPLSRGEVAMLFIDGYAGDGPGLLDVRSKGYGEDDDWHGLTREDVFGTDKSGDTDFVWPKWEPFELWHSTDSLECFPWKSE